MAEKVVPDIADSKYIVITILNVIFLVFRYVPLRGEAKWVTSGVVCV